MLAPKYNVDSSLYFRTHPIDAEVTIHDRVSRGHEAQHNVRLSSIQLIEDNLVPAAVEYINTFEDAAAHV